MSEATQAPVDGNATGLPPGAESGRRPLLLVLAVVAGLLVLGVAGYFLFLSGGEEEAAGPVVPAPVPTDTDKDGKGNKNGKGDKDKTEVPKAVDINFAVGRDPFRPLAAEAVIKEPVADTGSTDTGTGSGKPAPAPAPAPSVTPAPTVPIEVPVTTYTVTLISVDLGKDKATIEVDGKRYVLAVKDMFPSTKTGPFLLTKVGERSSGKGTATLVFGADAPVEVVQKQKVTFEN